MQTHIEMYVALLSSFHNSYSF